MTNRKRMMLSRSCTTFLLILLSLLLRIGNGFQQHQIQLHNIFQHQRVTEGVHHGVLPKVHSSVAQEIFQTFSTWNNRRSAGRNSLKVWLSSTENDENQSSQPLGEKNNGMEQKINLSKCYRVGSYLFGSMAALLLLMPDRTRTALLASKMGGAAGFGLAAGLYKILQGANDNDRLNSDTYQRLNLGLLAFNGLGLFSFPGEAAFYPSASVAISLSFIMMILRVYGAAIAFTGLKRGMGQPVTNNMARELVDRVKGTLQGLRVKDKKKAMTYRNCLLLVLFGVFSSAMDGIFLLRYMHEFNKSIFEVSLQWGAVARLLMISTMIYSLKDAAERDRLTGTTFIQLNVMVGLWSFLVAMGQSITPFSFQPYRGVEMFAFSLPFFIKAIKSQKQKFDKKMGKKEEPN